MMLHHREIDWLADRRPFTTSPDDAATDEARDALLTHIEQAAPAGAAEAAEPLAARRARRPRRRRHERARRLTLLGAAAAVAAALVAVQLGGGGGTGSAISGPESAVAAPLVRLSTAIQQAPAPRGDATLVTRTQSYPNSDDPTVVAHDLYVDSGKYYFGAKLQALRDAIAHDDDQGDATARMQAAAARAVTTPPDVARTEFMTAVLGKRPRTVAEDPPAQRPTHVARQDNLIWGAAIDTLVAGAGRADVRAGIMKLLATIPTVTPSDVTRDGRALLEIRSTAFAGHPYAERLYVDAKTGVPVRFLGGEPGKPVGVDTDYDIARVDVADVARG